MDKLYEAVKDMYEGFGLQYRGGKGTCYEFKVKDILVFFEMDEDGETVMVASNLGLVNPGTFRAEVMREALRHNGFPPPAFGRFGFSKKLDSLFLWHQIPLHRLSKDRLVQEIPPFVQTALIWKEALASATVPTAVRVEAGNIPTFMDILGITPEDYGVSSSTIEKLL